jgi:hypothetical protein
MRFERRALRSPLLGHAHVFVGMPDAIGATRYERRPTLHEERALPCEFVGHRSACRGRRSARLRMRCPFVGMLWPFPATLRPFLATLRPFLATLRPFPGTLRAFPAMLHAFVAMLCPFSGVLRALLGTRRVSSSIPGASGIAADRSRKELG